MTERAMIAKTPHGQKLLDLFDRLTARRVEHWTGSSDPRPEARIEPVAGLPVANVVTSKHETGPGHALILDIDHPAWLVKSTTPDHFHLYVDVPGGIPFEKYMRLLDALAECGVIERGYAEASKARGYTAARLPWVKKEPAPAPDDTPAPDPWATARVTTRATAKFDNDEEVPF